MPKEYTACVASEIKRGKPRKTAQRICAISYWKKHHVSVQKAHESGTEEILQSSLLEDLPVESELEAMDRTLLSIREKLIVLEEGWTPASEKPFRFRGVASIDNAFSANGRFYDAAFNTTMMDRTNAAIVEGAVVTVYARHGQAIGGFMAGPVHLPIGHAVKLFREENRIMYDATLSATRDGIDAAILISDGTVKGSSIRSYDFESKMVTIGDQQVEQMITAVLAGIDLADDPGIPGAGIVRILEDVTIEEVDNMDYGQITVEELKTKAPAIVEALLADSKLLLAESATAQAKLVSDASALKGQLDSATAMLAQIDFKLTVLEAVQNPLTSLAAKKLGDTAKLKSDLTKDAIDKVLEEARNEILRAAGINMTDGTPPGGPAPVKLDNVTEEHDSIMKNTPRG